MSPIARTTTILGRFPRHMYADTPGKRFATVVDGLDQELDVKSLQLVRVRRSHALGDADESGDLLLLGGLHGLKAEDLDILRLRLAAVEAISATLTDPASTPQAQQAAVAQLPSLLGLPADVFPSWPSEAGNTAPALARLAGALTALAAYSSQLDLVRGTLGAVIGLHRRGNGTVGALLGAAAAYLELTIDSVSDSGDLYWHIATCHDVLRLVRPEPPGSHPAATVLTPDPDIIALEDNPLRQQASEPIDRRHGDRFQFLRRGFESVPATVRVVGTADRTVAPMVVNLDSGFGLVFTGTVPDGQELRFESDGRATLAGANVARNCYSFSGGVFADATQSYPGDFRFAGDTPSAHDATFAVTAPVPDAFSPSAIFPHTEGLLGAANLSVGESRWAFFVRSASFGAQAAAPAAELAVPVFNAGVFDGSVFEPDTGSGTPSSGRVAFSWQEHEPFAARLWIPRRFSNLDQAGQVPVNERLRLLLDRHRAAAIHIYVEYADDRWTLPGGVTRDVGSPQAIGTVIEGTALWPGGGAGS